MYAHRHFGIDQLLGRRLADRIEVLLSTRTVLRRLTERDLARTQTLVGEDAGASLKALLDQRVAATQQALEALSLQYPDYSKELETAFLRRIALRLENSEYHTMAEEALISADVHTHLEQDIDARRRAMEARPRLDLGLNPERLVAKVPFLADEEPAMIREIAALLKPIVVVPGERVVQRGEAGDAMYFISSGAVEVGIEPDPITIGSGDFFGELALLTDKPRTADVAALSYCTLLALFRRDFTHLCERDEALRECLTSAPLGQIEVIA